MNQKKSYRFLRHKDRQHGVKDKKCYVFVTSVHRKTRLIESNAKCRYLKKLACSDFAAGVYLSAAPSPHQVFVWGGKTIFQVLNLVRWSIVLNSCIKWSPTQLKTLPLPTPPVSHTLSVLQVLHCATVTVTHGRGGGGGGELRGQFKNMGLKYKQD